MQPAESTKPTLRGLSPVPLGSMTSASQNQDEHSADLISHHQSRTMHRASSPSPLVLQESGSETRRVPSSPSPSVSRPPSPVKTEKVTWMSLPHKPQLAILTVARLSEPLTQTSLQSYLYHQLASFEPDASPAQIAMHVGFVVSAFPATQAFTSVLWGLMADSPRIGRKRVLVIGLLGTAAGSIGYGLSLSWQVAMFWRAFSGVLNGNVGVMRTMISEIVREKKYQSRAFLLMPMCFNIGTVIGPTLGGALADPVRQWPGVFGPGSFLGGEDGVWWMRHWPYALPNFVSAVFLISAACWVIFGLDETLEARRERPDWGRSIGRTITRFIQRTFTRSHHKYSKLGDSTAEPDTPGQHNHLHNTSITSTISSPIKSKHAIKTHNKLPISRMWTHNVLANLSSRFLLSLTVGTFQTLWFTFLSAPRIPSTQTATSTPSLLHFNGGLGLPPSQVGFSMAILGTLGITLQLTCYPLLSAYLGTTRSFRLPLPLFPLICILIPFLSLLPSNTAPPEPMSGLPFWTCLIAILSLFVLGRTFVLPASAILVNNSSPHPSRLGTLHGVAQSIGSAGRFLGPLVGGTVFGVGVQIGVVGLAWWVLAGVGVVNAVVGGFVREGDGWEVLMPGEVRRGGEVVVVGSEDGDGDGDGDEQRHRGA